jgi:nitronate monooxygenase
MLLHDWLDLELPIIQAPMAGVQDRALAIAVANAGALGSLPTAMLDDDGIRRELGEFTRHTARPYNLNFFCHTPPVPDPEREERWRQVLAPYYRELGLEPADAPSAPARAAFGPESADIVEEFRPAVVSFHFGLPPADLLARVKRAGARILSSATTVDEARWLENQGVDAIIAQGVEAGGHRGIFLTDDLSTQMGTFALLPQIVQAVRIPVIAAGGIADANGVAAALRLGAAAVQVGTSYLLCPEATTTALHRSRLRSHVSRDTALTNLFTGRPARALVNRLMRELGPISDFAPAFPLATAAIMALRAAAERRGSTDFSPHWAGANTTGCREVSATALTVALASAL